MNLTNRSFLKLLDYTPEEIEGLLDLAADLKAKKKAGIRTMLCAARTLPYLREDLHPHPLQL
mgnify:CR=1 FL=1